MEKADILREIRRTAAENGGVPLGFRKFARETGIKYADWQGKHWIRWSDVVREAGFAPNQFAEAYDDGELLEKYAQLARELGRLPVSGDLRMKARTDAEFPHDGPFRRFGGKAELVRRLLEYCQSREGYDDIARLCGAYAPRKRDVPDGPPCKEGQIGFVYLGKSGKFYKIGKSNAVGRREYELSIQLPEKLKMVHAIRTDDPSGIEEYWHKRFAEKRANGEWFSLDAADVAAFKRRKFM